MPRTVSPRSTESPRTGQPPRRPKSPGREDAAAKAKPSATSRTAAPAVKPAVERPTTFERIKRAWRVGVVISAVCHLVALFIFGVVVIERLKNAPVGIVDTNWSEEAPDLSEKIDLEQSAEEIESLTESLVEFDSAVPTLVTAATLDVPLSTPEAVLPSDAMIEDRGAMDLLATVPGTGGGSSGARAGVGEFFGAAAEGSRYVFVVDRSGSMTAKHSEGQGDTRMDSVKIELAESIRSLSPRQQFFIIFFGDDSLPMPARTLQPASPRARDHFLQWMMTVDADGGTKPQDSLTQALSLQPDVIYFLTDGEFDKKTQKFVLDIKQTRTKIHTIALGSKKGHDVLKEIAENNGGTFKFVP